MRTSLGENKTNSDWLTNWDWEFVKPCGEQLIDDFRIYQE